MVFKSLATLPHYGILLVGKSITRRRILTISYKQKKYKTSLTFVLKQKYLLFLRTVVLLIGSTFDSALFKRELTGNNGLGEKFFWSCRLKSNDLVHQNAGIAVALY